MNGRRNVAAKLVMAALVAMGVPACKRGHAATTNEPPDSQVVVNADSAGLLLTWIDDKGDFHVETRVADVPMMGRDAVRVVDPNKDEGSHSDHVSIADLRQARADGTFAVRTMTRADFEAIAVARREKIGPTLASAAPPAPSSSASPGPRSTSPARPAAGPLVVIYGAEWCGASHDAARYLRSKGIAYVEKDVEKDASAAREMQQKLASSGLRSGSIPVIEVRGKVMVGFNPVEIDGALGEPM